MQQALMEAQKAKKYNEIPIGALVVRQGVIIGRGHNSREIDECVVSHAEINAIKEASKHLGHWRLTGCDIYVTIEPCPMCYGAIYQSRIHRIIYGAKDPKAGACGSCVDFQKIPHLNHYCEHTGGILEDECRQLLKSFFKEKRLK